MASDTRWFNDARKKSIFICCAYMFLRFLMYMLDVPPHYRQIITIVVGVVIVVDLGRHAYRLRNTKIDHPEFEDKQ